MSETTKTKSRPLGALWKKSGVKADGTAYSFLTGNLEIDGKKIQITVNKSKMPEEERKEKKSPDYLIYKDDWVPGQTKSEAKAEKKTEDEPF